MSLDEVVAEMRRRFTPAQAGQTVTEARITAAEWNVLASFVYLRDAAKALAEATPQTEAKAVERIKDEWLLAQDAERAGKRPRR